MKQLSEYIEYYRDKPVAFAIDCLDITPTAQQVKFLNALLKTKKVSVKSGHGTGKSAAAAMAAIWFLICHKRAQIIITAPSKSQISLALWPRISELWKNLNPIFKQFFTKQAEKIYYTADKENWYLVSKTSNKDRPESMQGPHAENLLYILDEASAVPDEIFTSVYGSLTGKNNYLLLLSNPTRMSGEFFESHQSGSDYKRFTFNSEDSELVSKESIKRWSKFGKKSNEYKIRVLGQFPSIEAGALIPWEWVNAAQDLYKTTFLLDEVFDDDIIDTNSDPIIWGLDIAASGDDLSVLCKRRGNLLYEIKEFNFVDTTDLVSAIAVEYERTEKKYRPVNIICDEASVGKGPVDLMKKSKLPIVGVNAAWASNDPKVYFNTKSEMWCAASNWFRDESPLIVPNSKLIEQLSTMRTTPNTSGRIQIEKKDGWKKRHKNISPDHADSFVLTLYIKIEIPLKIYHM